MKKFIIAAITLFITTITVYAINDFVIDTNKLSFKNSKDTSIMNSFNDEYKVTYETTDNSKLKEELITLSKKTTYLLIGDFNNINETEEEYYKRHKEYLNLRYAPDVPKDENNYLGLDTNSQEYYDDNLSGLTIPGMFTIIDELDIKYTSFGDIRITISDDKVLSTVVLPNVTLKQEKIDNPSEYEDVKTNIILYYTFKKLNDEYKLYYLWAQIDDELNEYTSSIEDEETTGSLSIAPTYDTDLKEIYDFSKLDEVTEEQVTNIYNKNKDNIVMLSSFYNNYTVSNATGFFINNGIIITSWSFIEESLKEAQYIIIEDINGKIYEMEGIITLLPDSDIVLIKLKENINKKVNISTNKTNTLNPIFMISSKTKIGLSSQSGIIIALDDYISTSIPITQVDSGAPLIDLDGYVTGMMTSKSLNSSISMSTNTKVLKEIQDKFDKIEFDKIETISFDKLKSEYFYVTYNEEQINNNIKKSIWKKYSKIGNIEKNINLELKKASYKDGIVTLRYYNKVSDYIDNMQFATEFKKDLINSGYEEIVNSKEKCIYKNKKYKVIIMSEFDYLIIIMVKL